MAILHITLLWVLAILTIQPIWSCICLYRNYTIARRVGVPIRVIPIDHVNIYWLLVDKYIVRLLRRLPGTLGRNNLTRFNYRGWHEDSGIQAQDELGEVFMLVTPSHNWLYVADPQALMRIYNRGKDFPRWVEITKMLNVFGGPNIATSSGEQWKRHRAIVNTCLGKQINSIVWHEATRLGQQMAEYWGSKHILRTIGQDTRTISLDILSKACFGQGFDFEGYDELHEGSQSASFQSSLLTVMENALIILALTPKLLQSRWLPMPSSWRRVGDACATFRRHMVQRYNNVKDGVTPKEHTLLSTLTLAADGKGRLTEDEIYGTIFVVSFAGHDTTAHLITWAMYYLAANPGTQEWLHQEIRDILGDKPRELWDYRTDLPRLKRCMAVLYETLRVKTPAAEAKWTSDKEQTVTVHGRALTIPKNTLVIPSYWYVQKHEKYWGPDGMEWKPSRWISQRCNAHLEQPAPRHCEECANVEEVLVPPPSRGNYLGWSEGTRDCPAKRFSQVEWVAIMASLFRRWKIEPQRQEHEGLAEASKRVLDFIEEDTEYGGLLLQLMHPERTPLVFTRREV